MSVIGSTPTASRAGPPLARPRSLPAAPHCSPSPSTSTPSQNPFVYDDFRLIVENPSILNVWDLKSVIVRDITRPLVNLSYAIDTMIWGRIPLGYHVTNVVLHAINVMLVFWVALLAAEDRRRQAVHSAWAGGALRRRSDSPRPRCSPCTR